MAHRARSLLHREPARASTTRTKRLAASGVASGQDYGMSVARAPARASWATCTSRTEGITRHRRARSAALVEQLERARDRAERRHFQPVARSEGARPGRKHRRRCSAPHEELRASLRAQLAAGHPVTLVPGNHDADVARAGMRDALLGWLELGEDAPLDVVPWFVRRDGVHVEHGHVYDPDNAPTHPLVPPAPDTEPLGVALTRRFLAPNQAFDFAHATEITPLDALIARGRVFGARMPLHPRALLPRGGPLLPAARAGGRSSSPSSAPATRRWATPPAKSGLDERRDARARRRPAASDARELRAGVFSPLFRPRGRDRSA